MSRANDCNINKNRGGKMFYYIWCDTCCIHNFKRKQRVQSKTPIVPFIFLLPSFGQIFIRFNISLHLGHGIRCKGCIMAAAVTTAAASLTRHARGEGMMAVVY